MNHEEASIQDQNTIEARQRNGNQAVEVYEEPQQVAVFNGDPTQVMEQMSAVVKHVAKQIDNDQFVANIRNKKYPKVEWWTTVGASLGLFPVVIWSRRLKREDEIAYESRVEVHRQGKLVTSGEAVCSTSEKSWKGRDEYAIKSMSITRATGKAYRVGLSMIAVMAGLEGTPAEEIPSDQGQPQQQPKQPQQYSKPQSADKPWLNETPKGSNEITKEWEEVVDKLSNGEWAMGHVLDRYKLSKANRGKLEAIVKQSEQPPSQGVQQGAQDDLPF